MRHFTAIFLILIIAMASSCKFFKEKKLFGKKDRMMAEWQAKEDSIMVADSLKRVNDRLNAIENARLDSIRMAEQKQSELTSRYNIIVGSFITPEYAETCAENFRNMGYDARIIKKENSRFSLVSAESHESVRRAIARVNQFQDTVATDSWIFVRR